MKLAIGADDASVMIDGLAAELRAQGHEVDVRPVRTWGAAALEIAHSVAANAIDFGIVCCWTGTGVTIAANKVAGVRAALCTDTETARGARQWNDANVLGLSLRLTSPAMARGIVLAWIETPYGGAEDESLLAIREAERAS